MIFENQLKEQISLHLKKKVIRGLLQSPSIYVSKSNQLAFPV